MSKCLYKCLESCDKKADYTALCFVDIEKHRLSHVFQFASTDDECLCFRTPENESS